MNSASSKTGVALTQGQINAKHRYRFGYLKSEHWSNLRIAKLAEQDAKCQKCGLRSLSNDVHHWKYRKLYDVTMSDLAVFCRLCHDRTHQITSITKAYCKEKIEVSEALDLVAGVYKVSTSTFESIPEKKRVNFFWRLVKMKEIRGTDEAISRVIELTITSYQKSLMKKIRIPVVHVTSVESRYPKNY